jgi:beta-lactamase regulating signal transducer with metallopeptidase domain
MTSSVLTHLGQVLLQSLWQGGILGAMLMILLAFIRQSSVRYTLACLTLFVLLGWVIVSWLQVSSPSTMPYTLENNHAVSDQPTPLDSIPTQSVTSIPSLNTNQSLQPTVREIPQPRVSLSEQMQARAPLLNLHLQDFLPYFSLLWMLGVVLLSLRLLISFYLLRRYCKQSFELMEPCMVERMQMLAKHLKLRQHITLLQTNALTVPAVMGVLKPLVLLPSSLVSGLSVGQLELLLAHELAHVKRRDYLVNILQTLAETLLFYHPVVWWVSKTIRQEREHCCDDLALQITGQSAVDYADVLLRLEKSRQTLALAASSGSLVRRVERLLNPPKAGVSGGSSVVALLLIVCLSLTFVVGAVSAQPIQVSKVPYVFNAGIAVDPTNPKRIAVAVNELTVEGCDGCETNALLYTSLDGGSNWQEQRPTSSSFLHPIFDNKGDFFAATNVLTLYDGLSDFEDVLPLVSKADADLRVPVNDDGSTAYGAALTSDVAIDSETGIFYMSYLEWSVIDTDFWVGQPELRTSKDAGKTWSEPLGALKQSVWETNAAYPLKTYMLLGGQGRLAIVWAQAEDVVYKNVDNELFESIGNDFPYTLWVVASEDGGQTFSKPSKISILGDTTSWGLISTAHANGVYYILSKQVFQRDGRLGITLRYSEDNGKTWKFSLVNGSVELYSNFPIEVAPGLSVAPDGTVDVVFYGQTNAPDCISIPAPYIMSWIDKCNYNVYHTFSKDDGKSPRAFSEPQRLNDEPIVGSNFTMLYGRTTPGDFIDIASTNEASYPVWISNREGVEGTQAYMMKIER